jgi:hypothetical protein
MGLSEECLREGSSVVGPVKMRKVVIDGDVYSNASLFSFASPLGEVMIGPRIFAIPFFSGKLIFFKIEFLDLFLQFVEGPQNVINLYG